MLVRFSLSNQSHIDVVFFIAWPNYFSRFQLCSGKSEIRMENQLVLASVTNYFFGELLYLAFLDWH